MPSYHACPPTPSYHAILYQASLCKGCNRRGHLPDNQICGCDGCDVWGFHVGCNDEDGDEPDPHKPWYCSADCKAQQGLTPKDKKRSACPSKHESSDKVDVSGRILSGVN